MSLVLRPAAISDLGLRRANNEDAAHASPRLLAVADGMGGAPAGEVASDIVIRALLSADPADDGYADRATEDADPLSRLHAAIEQANRELRAAIDEDAEREGMGTTLTALLLTGDEAALVHVGDSRGYLLRDGALRRLTRDDTLVQALVDRGALSSEEARRHPQRSLVTQVLLGLPVTLTTTRLTVKVGDRFLLCSDGLSDYVADDDIAKTLAAGEEPQPCAEALVELAVRAGAPDNVTVVVADVDFADLGRPEPPPQV